MSSLSYPTGHDIDTQAEVNAERYEHALKALSPGDVLASMDELVAQIRKAHGHPVYALVAHGLQCGTAKRTGTRAPVSDMVGAADEPLIDKAITRLIEEIVADANTWGD